MSREISDTYRPSTPKLRSDDLSVVGARCCDKTLAALEIQDKSWLIRPLFTCPSRRVKSLQNIGFVLVFILIFISPLLFTLGWHMRHGNVIVSRGKPIYVPLKWTAEISDGNDAFLMRLPFTIPLNGHLTESIISIGQEMPPLRSRSLKDDYKTWETLFWNLHSGIEDVSGPFTMGSEPREAFCMEGTFGRQRYADVSCLVLGGRWRADFNGDKSYLPEFFAIIQKLN